MTSEVPQSSRPPPAETWDVVIIGAGITGLACAWALRQAGARVLVVEAAHRVGGCIETVRREDGFVFEGGPHTVRGVDDALIDHLEEIGLGDDMVELTGSGARYILRDGALVRLPSSPVGFVTSPFLSPGAKLRLLTEPLRGPLEGDDPSLGAFVAHRLGADVRDGPLDAFVGGIWAGDPDAISARAAFPDMAAGVERHGSLLRWALSRRRQRGGDRPRRRRGIFSLAGGLSRWPETLAAALPDGHLRTGTRAVALHRGETGWTVELEDDAAGGRVSATHVVLTGDPRQTRSLAGSWLSDSLSELMDSMRSASMAVVHLGYARGAVARPPEGFGVLIPRKEGRPCLGVLFVSSILPGRAPEGFLTTTTFVGGIRDEHRLEMADDELVALAEAEHRELLGFDEAAEVSHVRRWEGVLPQYEVGHGDLTRAIEAQEARLPSLHLAGRFRGGVSVPDCWRRGMELGRRLGQELSGAGHGSPASTDRSA